MGQVTLYLMGKTTLYPHAITYMYEHAHKYLITLARIAKLSTSLLYLVESGR